MVLKPSALLDKADIIHITHGQSPKCGQSKCIIIASKEVNQEVKLLDENLDFQVTAKSL